MDVQQLGQAGKCLPKRAKPSETRRSPPALHPHLLPPARPTNKHPRTSLPAGPTPGFPCECACQPEASVQHRCRLCSLLCRSCDGTGPCSPAAMSDWCRSEERRYKTFPAEQGGHSSEFFERIADPSEPDTCFHSIAHLLLKAQTLLSCLWLFTFSHLFPCSSSPSWPTDLAWQVTSGGQHPKRERNHACWVWNSVQR